MVAAQVAEFARSPRDSPGPRDRILDIYGSFVRDFGGWIAVADLLELLELLDVKNASARSALSRMKRRGELLSVEREGVRGYTLTDAAEAWFADGTVRIMGPMPELSNTKWLVASFTVPESDRHLRYQIRSRLSDLGFGQLAGGLMIAPAQLREESIRALERAELITYVDFWHSEHVGARPVEEIVSFAWDLPAISAAYHEYLEHEEKLRSKGVPAGDDEAFVQYLRHINAWRVMPFMDPGIPLQYLPNDWPAAEARSAFDSVSKSLRDAAWRYFKQVASDERPKKI